MMPDEEIPYVPVLADVTCHTPGCVNEGITIRVTVDQLDPRVVCGPCCQPVADIEPVEEASHDPAP